MYPDGISKQTADGGKDMSMQQSVRVLIGRRQGVFNRFGTDVLKRKYKQPRTSYGVPMRNHIYYSYLKPTVALA